MLLRRISSSFGRLPSLRLFSSSSMKLGRESDFPEKTLKTIPVDENRSIVAARIRGQIYAVSGKCTHWGAPMGQGYLDGYELLCPWHIAPFDIRNGASLQGPGVAPLLSFKTTVKDGEVWADIGSVKEEKQVEVTDSRKFVIIGSGGAGQACAETLRKAGFRGTVTVLTQEAVLPIDKPVLSKSVTGDVSTFLLRPQSFYDKQRIDLKLQHKVTAVDVKTKAVTCANGAVFQYDKLLVATGAAARVLKPYQQALASIQGVHTLRDPIDSAPLQASLKTSKSVVIIGGSFLGMEFATSIRKALPAVKVTVLDVDDVPLARALGVDISKQLLELQRGGGIDVRTGTTAKRIEDSQGKVAAVTVAAAGKEERLPADTVLMATGAQVRTELLPKGFLAADGSAKVNAFLQSPDPDVFVAGDIATFFSLFTESYQRIEHWSVAQDMGRLAALNMIGVGKMYTHVPFFWTNLFGNASFIGSSHGSDSFFTETNGETDPNKKAQNTFFFKEERVIGVAQINRYGAAPRLRFAFERGLFPSKSEITSGKSGLSQILKRVEETAGGCCGRCGS